MKKGILFLGVIFAAVSILYSYDKTDSTNDFYDNRPTYELKQDTIKIYGEIENPGMIVDLSKLAKRSVIVKEAVLQDDKDTFVGAYNYTGYSLYDILNKVVIKRKGGSFKSPIDLYVKIENDQGDSIVASWGEIYYPSVRYHDIIATEVSPVLPLVTDSKWPIPKSMKLVMGEDLLSERNILSPTKITVESIKVTEKEKNSFAREYSDQVRISKNESEITDLYAFPEEYKTYSYPCTFYGRGLGFQKIGDFNGIPLQYFLGRYFSLNKKNIINGMFAVISKDGYRAAFSFSEIFNKNNHADVLLLDKSGDKSEGKFKIFPGNDFFAERAIKCIANIKFFNVK